MSRWGSRDGLPIDSCSSRQHTQDSGTGIPDNGWQAIADPYCAFRSVHVVLESCNKLLIIVKSQWLGLYQKWTAQVWPLGSGGAAGGGRHDPDSWPQLSGAVIKEDSGIKPRNIRS